jgi:hypothetical protein
MLKVGSEKGLYAIEIHAQWMFSVLSLCVDESESCVVELDVELRCAGWR